MIKNTFLDGRKEVQRFGILDAVSEDDMDLGSPQTNRNVPNSPLKMTPLQERFKVWTIFWLCCELTFRYLYSHTAIQRSIASTQTSTKLDIDYTRWTTQSKLSQSKSNVSVDADPRLGTQPKIQREERDTIFLADRYQRREWKPNR